MKKLTYLPILIVLAVFGLSSCGEDDESDEFWNVIPLIDKSKSVAFVFSSTEIDKCGEHAQPNLEKVLNGKKTEIKSDKVNGYMLFPSISDELYSPAAEELKFIFDENGNNTFKSYPSFVGNMHCFDIDTSKWFDTLAYTTSLISPIILGTRETTKGSQSTIYIKGKYSQDISNPHSVAVYLFKKQLQGTQNTIANGEINFSHKNVIYSSITNSYGKKLPSSQANDEMKEKFNYDLTGQSRENIGVLIVIYELTDGIPSGVLNSLAI